MPQAELRKQHVNCAGLNALLPALRMKFRSLDPGR